MSGARSLAHRLGLRRALKSAAGVLGFDLLTRNYYSPVPDLDALPAGVWERESPMRGIRWDLDAQLRFLAGDLAPYLPEWRPPLEPGPDPAAYHVRNGTYEGIDADTAYAVVRHARPGRIVELGSGFSTLVLAAARERNAAEGHPAEQVAFDPFFRADLAEALHRAADVRPVSATDVPEEEITRLEPGDVLFVDTTHTVKIAGDVNRIVLDLLPLVPAGVLVHFHDVFLPGEYPADFFTEMDVVWAEQYLLQAYLAHNDTYEVLLSTAALHRHRENEVRGLIAHPPVRQGPSALWLRRSEPV